MRRAAAGVAAAIALVLPAVAHASASHDAAVARRGITHALKQHWLQPVDAQRYRASSLTPPHRFELYASAQSPRCINFAPCPALSYSAIGQTPLARRSVPG